MVQLALEEGAALSVGHHTARCILAFVFLCLYFFVSFVSFVSFVYDMRMVSGCTSCNLANEQRPSRWTRDQWWRGWWAEQTLRWRSIKEISKKERQG